ncbi:MAG: thermosome subunit alpha [Candidatus Bathyarchaeia archaeon]
MSSSGVGSRVLPLVKKGAKASSASEARRHNIMVGWFLAEVLKSVFGPRGMDKLIIDPVQKVSVSNEGATVLWDVSVEHPVGKLLVGAAKAQRAEVGDGATSVVLLAGALLKEALKLVDDKVHPTIIASGYMKAKRKALAVLDDIAIPVGRKDKERLRQVALAAVRTKCGLTGDEALADCALNAVQSVMEPRGREIFVDDSRVQIFKRAGGSLADTQLIRGVIVDPINKELPHPSLPSRVDNARIAVVRFPFKLDFKREKFQFRIKSLGVREAMNQERKAILTRMVDKLFEAKASVVLTQRMDMDPYLVPMFAKNKIMAVKRIRPSDIDRLTWATGARCVTLPEELKENDLGYARVVEERKVGDDSLLFAEGCKDPKAVAILIRGGLDKTMDEAERAVKNAMGALKNALLDSRGVAAGGAAEMEISSRMKRSRPKMSGRELLAYEAYAKALEFIPATLIRNAGKNPLDVLAELRVAHSRRNGVSVGFEAHGRRVEDMVEAGIIEALLVKKRVIAAATEVAVAILKIGDIIIAKKTGQLADALKEKKWEEEAREAREEGRPHAKPFKIPG